MGLLLDRLPVADALYRTSNAILPRKPSAPLVSGMLLGALLGPMNGSVGASVLGLSRVVAPRLAAEGISASNRHALVAVASTLGVLVPPSLVLILLERRDAVGPYHRGDGDGAERPSDQHPGHLPRGAAAGRDFPRALPRARLDRRAERGAAAGPRAAQGRRGLARRHRARTSARAPGGRHDRLFLCGRGGRDGRLYAAGGGSRHGTPARRSPEQGAERCHRAHRRVVCTPARRHHLHHGAAAARHCGRRSAGWSPRSRAATSLPSPWCWR